MPRNWARLALRQFSAGAASRDARLQPSSRSFHGTLVQGTQKSAEEVGEHKNYIPIFSGCFDWHSAVHGHWLLAAVLNRFPDDAELTKQIVTVFDQQFKVNYPHKSSLIA